MVRVYRPPTFNLFCAVWLGELPDDLTTWSGLVPTRVPDLEYPCQLYFPRWSYGDWKHAYSDKCPETLLRTATTELRLPKDADVRAPWGVSSVSKWSEVPLIECPLASGRLYVGILQDIRHCNFPNEYVVCLLGQIGPIPPLPPPPPPPFAAELPGGGALVAHTTGPVELAQLPGGGALESEWSNPIAAHLPGGGALERAVTDRYDLAGGGALVVGRSPTLWPASLPGGGAITSDVDTGNNFAALLGAGGAVLNKELFPSKAIALPGGGAVDGGSTSVAKKADLPGGGALTVSTVDLVFDAPCATAGIPRKILATCVAQSGTLSGWVGQNVTVTYNSGTHAWTGSLTKGGHTGTMTFTGTGGSAWTFAGNSGTDWSVSAPMSGQMLTCGASFTADQPGSGTTDGLNLGNTEWSFQPG